VLRRRGGTGGVFGAEAEFLQRGYKILACRNSFLGGENGLLADTRGICAGKLRLALKFRYSVEAKTENVAECAACSGD
jgi:hypothetical protein